MFILLFLPFSLVCAAPARVVVTFSGPSSAVEVPQEAVVVKRYGRRLVLELDDNVSSSALFDWWPPGSVLDVEEDLLVSLAIFGNGSWPALNGSWFPNSSNITGQTDFSYNDTLYVESQAQFALDSPVEWQFADDEPFSTHAEAAWRLGLTGDPSLVIAVIDSGLAVQAQTPSFLAHGVPGYDFISDAFYSLDGDGRDDDPTDPGDADPDACPTPTWHGTMMAASLAGRHDLLPGFHSMAPTVSVQVTRATRIVSPGSQA